MKKKKDILENKKQELKFSGIIELWVNDVFHKNAQFKSKAQRTEIINNWIRMLGKPMEPRKVEVVIKPMSLISDI